MRKMKHFVWQLLVAHLVTLHVCRGDVYITTHTYTLDPIPSLGADFGPELPEEGISGTLRSASPEDACSPLTNPDFKTPWVALVARQQQLRTALNCTFDIKVRHAQEAGAMAAIVYDDEYESLIIMSKPRDHPDPLIPSVFVSEKAGILMLKLMALEEDDGVHVRLTPSSAVAWMSMVMSAVLGLLALTVVFSTFYLMRSWSQWLSNGGTVGPRHPGAGAAGGVVAALRNTLADGGLPPHVLRALPVIVYDRTPSVRAASRQGSLRTQPSTTATAAVGGQGGGDSHAAPEDHVEVTIGEEVGALSDAAASCHEEFSSNSSEYGGGPAPAAGAHAGETKHMCTVCLENYAEGDKLRVLPCHHRFHMQCIDQWLAARRVCPMCKHDASKPLQPPPNPEQQGEGVTAGPAGASGTAAGGATGRRSWRRPRLVGLGNQPQVAVRGQPPHDNAMLARRAALRARITRWMGLRPFQRQALLHALDNDLAEPLMEQIDEAAGTANQPVLPDVPDLETGLVTNTSNNAAQNTNVSTQLPAAFGFQDQSMQGQGMASGSQQTAGRVSGRSILNRSSPPIDIQGASTSNSAGNVRDGRSDGIQSRTAPN